MQPYLTPDRLRTMRVGRGLTGYSSLDMAELIADASAIADAYCNIAMTPEPGSLRGGTVVREQHSWAYPTSYFDQGQRRIFLFQQPVREVTEFRLLVAAGAVAAIPEETLVVNNTERWIEVTSLAIASNSGLFGVTGWIVPIGGLNNPMAEVSYTYGHQFAETEERAYPIADDNVTTFQTAHGFWTNADVDVLVDDVVVTTGFTLDRETGRVVFDGDQTDAVVKVTYVHELDRSVPAAVGLICGHLAGVEKNRARGLAGGVTSVKVGEISITRGMKPSEAAGWLEVAVPEAASLLNGHRMFWVTG